MSDDVRDRIDWQLDILQWQRELERRFAAGEVPTLWGKPVTCTLTTASAGSFKRFAIDYLNSQRDDERRC